MRIHRISHSVRMSAVVNSVCLKPQFLGHHTAISGAYSDKLPHLHMHLVPKYTDGPSWGTTFTMMPEPKQLLSDADYAALIGSLRAALA